MKINSIAVISAKDSLMHLKDAGIGLWECPAPVSVLVGTDRGTYRITTDEGFLTDMRSGPWFLKFFGIPKLGRVYERLSWWLHDVGSYDVGFTKEEDGELLFASLTLLAGWSECKARFISRFVTMLPGWYGKPKEGSAYSSNVPLIHVTFTPRIG